MAYLWVWTSANGPRALRAVDRQSCRRTAGEPWCSTPRRGSSLLAGVPAPPSTTAPPKPACASRPSTSCSAPRTTSSAPVSTRRCRPCATTLCRAHRARWQGHRPPRTALLCQGVHYVPRQDRSRHAAPSGIARDRGQFEHAQDRGGAQLEILQEWRDVAGVVEHSDDLDGGAGRPVEHGEREALEW